MGVRTYMKAYHSLLTDLEALTDAEFGTFMRGCLRYSETGEIPVFGDRLLDALFATQKRLIDEADAVYEDEFARRSAAGSVAANARWHKNNATECDLCESYKSHCDDAIDATYAKTKTKTKTKEILPNGSTKKFTPPTVDEVAAYCEESGNSVDAVRFVSFYQQKGWMVGKNKMVDWKAAVRNWEQRDKAEHPKAASAYRNEELEKLEVDLNGGDFSW